MAQLRIKNGPATGSIFEIDDETITIGRDENAVVCIANTSTSRNHAEVFTIGQMCFVKDLGSRNGTMVNNEKITEELLQEGDSISVGGIHLVFETGAIKNNENIAGELEASDFSGPTTELSLDELGLDTASSADTNESLVAIYNLSKVISNEVREGSLLSKTASVIHQMLNAQGVYFFSVDPEDNKHISLKGKFECEGASMKMVRRSILKRVMKFSKAVLTLDATLDQRFNANESVVTNNIHSAIAAPLISRGKTIGIVYALKVKLYETFDDSALELLTLCGIQVGSALDNFENIRHEERNISEILEVVTRSVELRFPILAGHSQRVGQYATALAENINLPPAKLRSLQYSAIMHDAWRLGIEDTTESNPLVDDETLVPLCKKLFKSMTEIPQVLPIILSMFERYDGSGFPEGIVGDAISIESQILAVANYFDMLTTFGNGADEEPLSTNDALVSIQDLAGAHFSPQVCAALQATFTDGTLFLPFNKK